MSIVKRCMEEEEEGKHAVAVDLLLEAGVLERCERHDNIIYQTGDVDVVEAYKLGNTKWAEHSGLFKDRKEMTDIIKSESENVDYANDGCEICREQMARD